MKHHRTMLAALLLALTSTMALAQQRQGGYLFAECESPDCELAGEWVIQATATGDWLVAQEDDATVTFDAAGHTLVIYAYTDETTGYELCIETACRVVTGDSETAVQTASIYTLSGETQSVKLRATENMAFDWYMILDAPAELPAAPGAVWALDPTCKYGFPEGGGATALCHRIDGGEIAIIVLLAFLIPVMVSGLLITRWRDG